MQKEVITVSDRVIVVHERDIPGTLAVPHHKVIVTGRSFILAVPRQHALDADAHALHGLDGRPAGRT